MNADTVLLIDLSGVAHMIWHVSGNEPDPSHVSNAIVARVRSLATDHPRAAICCDSGKSFRADIDPTYKANRDTDNRAPLRHQMDVACDRLKKEGYIVWAAKGFEADDIIATATAEAMKIDGAQVLIASSDKDLLQLVNGRVSAKSLINGNIVDAEAVKAKFGVTPAQMLDYLCLVGDTSDNIKGAKGIGGVTAARLLSEHGSIQAIYDKMAHGVVPGMTPSVRSSFVEFADRWPVVRQLIALRSDVPLPFAEIAAERTAPPMEDNVGEMDYAREQEAPEPECAQCANPNLKGIHTCRADTRVPFEKGNDANNKPLPEVFTQPATKREMTGVEYDNMRAAIQAQANPTTGYAAEAMKIDGARQQLPVVAEFSQQLEPRTMPEAITLAKHMFESRLFSAYGTPQAVLATVLAGRELGIPAMASLRAFHIIEGRPTMSAGTIQSLVIKSGKAKYFRCTERTNERATFETQRGDDPPMSLSFSVEDGRRAWPKDDTAFAKSGWGKNPADMCVARASTKLARLVYPDVVAGLYAPEEME